MFDSVCYLSLTGTLPLKRDRVVATLLQAEIKKIKKIKKRERKRQRERGNVRLLTSNEQSVTCFSRNLAC
jgi:hypothetical protein